MVTISYIYGLFDPEEQIIRYVGQSTRPIARLGGHHSVRTSSNGFAVKHWISEMLLHDKRPHMIILEVCRLDVAHEIEAKWYQRIHGTGIELVNEPSAIRRTKVHEKSQHYKHRLDPQQFCIIEPESFYICHEPHHEDSLRKFGAVLKFVSMWEDATRTVAVTLAPQDIATLEQLGNGNVSAGIRKAIELVHQQEMKNHEQPRQPSKEQSETLHAPTGEQ